MQFLNSAALLLLCMLASITHGQSRLIPSIEPGVTQELAEHRKARLSNINYRLELILPAQQSEPIRGSNSISFELSDPGQPLVLDFRESPDKVLSVRVNEQDSDFEFAAEHIIVPAAELLTGPNRIFIEFIAGDSSLNRNPDFLYTLFVPDRARTAFPLFDQPNLKATYDLTLTLPANWDAIANGALAETTDLGDSKRMEFTRTDSISS